ncbi:MAG: hypothetical protein ACLTGI_00485 [Hoylesella buccalis]
MFYAICDCDNCYVSCERVFRPDLNGKPVVVLSNNDGCVVARSKEAKQLGIKAGLPYYQMKEQFPAEELPCFEQLRVVWRTHGARHDHHQRRCSTDVSLFH